VEPGSWRRGIGRLLLEAALARLRDGGWRQATLWVFAANDRARAFYERFGFAADGAELVDDAGGPPEIRMRATLAAGARAEAPADAS